MGSPNPLATHSGYELASDAPGSLRTRGQLPLQKPQAKAPQAVPCGGPFIEGVPSLSRSPAPWGPLVTWVSP